MGALGTNDRAKLSQYQGVLWGRYPTDHPLISVL